MLVTDPTPYRGRRNTKRRGRKSKFPWWLKTRKGYAAYLESEQWLAFRKRYFEAHPKRCSITRGPHSGPIHLHHISYRRIGNERPTDVIPLCEFHHRAVHVLIRAGEKLHLAHRKLEASG